METDLRTVDFEELELEVRAESERILEGVIMNYGETIEINGRLERFLPGAFGDVDPDTVLLLEEHKAPIGRGVSFVDDGDKVTMAFKVADTPRGSEILQLASERVIRGLSVGFKEIRKRLGKDGTIEHVKAALKETSTVRWPAYTQAAITGTRSTEVDEMDNDVTMADEGPDKLAELETRMEAVGTLEERMDSFSEALATMTAPEPDLEERGVDPLDWFRFNAAQAINDEIHVRALADVVGTTGGPDTDASGLMPTYEWNAGLVNVLDGARPFYAHLGRMPFPPYGDDISLPVVKSGPKVGKRTGQKQAVNSEKLVVVREKFDAQWFDGGIDVALELIRQSTPAVMGILWDRLLKLYAAQVEAYAIEIAEAAATASGGALKVDTYKNLVTDLITQSLAIKTATGAPGNVVAADTASWIGILGLTDSTDRRQLATIGRSNADGSANLLAQSVTVGGIEIFHAGVTAPVMFNTAALKGTDTGPQRVEVLNVEKLGRDIAVYGAAIVAPVIPAGVVAFKTA